MSIKAPYDRCYQCGKLVRFWHPYAEITPIVLVHRWCLESFARDQWYKLRQWAERDRP